MESVQVIDLKTNKDITKLTMLKAKQALELKEFT
jgi:hypothetical protein